MPEGPVVVRVVGYRCVVVVGAVVRHIRVVAVRALLGAIVGGAVLRGVGGVVLRWDRVEELGALGVGGYDGDFVAVVEGKVGVDEDEDVGDGGGEGEGRGEEGPGVGVRVEDYSQEGGRRL